MNEFTEPFSYREYNIEITKRVIVKINEKLKWYKKLLKPINTEVFEEYYYTMIEYRNKLIFTLKNYDEQEWKRFKAEYPNVESYEPWNYSDQKDEYIPTFPDTVYELVRHYSTDN